MISEKMREQMRGEGLIREMFEKGIAMKAEFGAENVFDFSLGNPNAPAPEKVHDAVIKIMETMPPMAIHSYMPNAGYPEVRVEVAKHINPRFGTAYSEKNIIMTAGAGSAISIVMRALLDKDDEVVVLAPYFPEYKAYVENYYGKIKVVKPRDDGSFLPDLDSLRDSVNERTKCVIVDTPNNPSGVVYPESVIQGIAEVLREKEEEIGHPVYLVSDEPYREICYDNRAAWDLSSDGSDDELPWIPSYYDDTIVTYSYSKALSVPGERIGNIIIPDSADGAAELIQAVTTANLITGVVNAPSLMQRVIARCLDARPDVEFYRGNRDELYDIVTEAGFEAVKPGGAFYLWMKVPDGDDRAFTEKAAEHRILMVPGSAFAGPGYVRLSYCVDRDTIKRSRNAFLDLGKETIK